LRKKTGVNSSKSCFCANNEAGSRLASPMIVVENETGLVSSIQVVRGFDILNLSFRSDEPASKTQNSFCAFAAGQILL
jgi:hypothetical protein